MEMLQAGSQTLTIAGDPRAIGESHIEIAVFVKIAHPAVVRILAAVPSITHLILDTEHGAFTEPDLEVLTTLIRLSGKRSIVRVSAPDPLAVGRALDRGADGVMVPRSAGAKDVALAVQGLVLAPEGLRGWDPTISGGDYSVPGSTLRRPSQPPRCLAQVETRGALEEAVTIARVRGVTDLFVGPADLSRALGTEGSFFAEAVSSAIESLPGRVAGSSARLGLFVDSAERARWAYSLGYRFFAIAPDVLMLAKEADRSSTAIADLLNGPND